MFDFQPVPMPLTNSHPVSNAPRLGDTTYQRALVEALNRVQAIIEFDLSGHVLHANDLYLQVMGYRLDDILGQHHRMFCEADYVVSGAYRAFWQRLGQGEVHSGEFLRRGEGGRQVWLQASYNPVLDDAGRPTRIVKFATDITERKRQDWLLRRTQQALEMSNEAARIGTWEWSSHTGQTQWSSTALGLLAPPAGQAPSLEDWIGRTHSPHLLHDAMATALQDGQGWDMELLFHTYRGEPRWLRMVGRADEEPGQGLRLYGTLQDIHQRRLRELDLAQAREVAEKASLSKDLFLTTMSHELRTPMNAIMGFGQLLELNPQLTTDQRDNVQEMLQAGRHLLDLLNDILDLTRITSGHIDLSPEPVALREVLQECEQLVRPAASARHLTLAFPSGCDAWLWADRVRLKQILLNLLTNAVKYNREAGQVWVVVAAESEQRTAIDVIDTGPGIAEHLLPDLFEPFKRLGAEASHIEGTGIGLTIARQLTDLMGGRIEVHSQVGQGSTFRVVVPNAPTGPSAIPHPAQAQATPAPRARRVLYIDDNPVNLKLVERVLQARAGCTLLTSLSPESGLALAREATPDLVLLDINMPGLDGFQVLRLLRSTPGLAHVPVVAVTASAAPHDVRRGLALGFQAYVTKPIDVPHFLATLDRCLPP